MVRTPIDSIPTPGRRLLRPNLVVWSALVAVTWESLHLGVDRSTRRRPMHWSRSLLEKLLQNNRLIVLLIPRCLDKSDRAFVAFSP
jgi:hypothetical protein